MSLPNLPLAATLGWLAAGLAATTMVLPRAPRRAIRASP